MVIPTFCLAQSSVEPPKLLYREDIIIAPTISFGWGKSLSDEQMEYYSIAQMHALYYGEVGEKVKWQHNGVHGYVKVQALEPKGTGYCKHVTTVLYAFGKKDSLTLAACHTYRNGRWDWYSLE